MKKVLFLTVLALNWSFSYCQTTEKVAQEYFDKENFIKAGEAFENLSKENPDNYDFQLKAGISFLIGNADKTKAMAFLEKASQNPKADKSVKYSLGLAYHINYRLDDAIKLFEECKVGAAADELANLKRQIANCNSAKKLMKRPLSVTFENLGVNVNTPFPDYYPFVSSDESMLVFTSRRKGNVGGRIEFDGYFSSDVYLSFNSGTEFAKARNAGALINAEYDEQAVGLSDNASTMFVYLDNIKEYGDIYVTYRGTKSYGKIEKLDESVNSPAMEASATLSTDGNTLYFSSSREGGFGGLDLYMTKKLPDGTWALPQNMGPKINSEYDEDFPYLYEEDGQVLYFTSEGHESMGGYDLFKSYYNEEDYTWGPATNIGYPINTPQDEKTISFSSGGKYAFVSALRQEGQGDFDIYKITFKDIAPTEVVYRVSVEDAVNNERIEDAYINIYDKNGEDKGKYKPNANTGIFTVVLMPGVYDLEISSENYSTKVEEWKVTNADLVQHIIEKKIKLSN